MAHQIKIIRQDLNGDEAHQRVRNTYLPSYDLTFEQVMELSAGIKDDVALPDGLSIEHVYLESVDEEEIQVYKNLSPEYWTFDKVFQVFDTDISQLALECATATSVYIWIGGSL